ncbi:MAG TPA: gamma-glutamyltransferase [Bryobacteraceae bacterium]|nr:gamma-glutamyltransferase [Bryobacteraceae bacterium]
MRILAAALAAVSIGQAQDQRSHARSLVITQQGIVATSHTLASQAGAQILARGGSAVDAAIAANAVLSVTEPMMCGPGGDLFVLYRDAKTRRLTGLNASGWTGKRVPQLTGVMPSSGIHTVTVPGAVDGWSRMHKRFGRLPWKSLFGPAIHYAEKGYPVPEILSGAWLNPTVSHLNEQGRRLFLPDGRSPQSGDVFRNPEIVRFFRVLADQGSDAFYRGEIARAILKTSDLLGGTLAADDLAEFQSEWVDPISTDYRGWRIYELPPNGQGMAALQILNILETFRPAAGGPRSLEELHKRIEATKIAYADLLRFNADPRTAKAPVAGLISKQYARKRAEFVDPAKASCDVSAGNPPSGDTTYLSVVDRDGNIASWIQSISAAWGSGIPVEGFGFILHNRGSFFVLDPKHPNVLAPRKRPFHTIIPAFMERGEVRIGFGIMGGSNQPLAHAQWVSNIVDFGMNMQAAMEEPRYTKRTFAGCEVSIESRIPPATIDALRELGHNVTVHRDYSIFMGRGQAVMHDSRRKVNFGASDPRADGSAEPEPPATP